MNQLTMTSATGRRLLWRDWKSGELNILVCSLLLAIATVTCISLFTSRIQNSIYQEASHFLAADAKVAGSLKAPDEWRNKAKDLGLSTSDITYFRAMAFAGDNMVLAQVKATDDVYPLKGSLTVGDPLLDSQSVVTAGPAIGEAWLAPRLFKVLDIAVGDRITIGEAEFLAKAAIFKEPDSGQSIFGVAPRIMIHQGDVAKTEAVQLGSRINYEWLLKGDPQKISTLKSWLEPKLGDHYRWVGVKGSNISIDSALTRAERFLLLTGCLSVVLSGVAIALAARRYAHRRQSQVALLKTLGSTPTDIFRLYFQNLLYLGLASVVLGSLLGWVLHWGILFSLGNLIPTELESANWLAYSTGAVTGFVSLWAFAAPPIFSLRWVSPAKILRDSISHSQNLTSSSLLGLGATLGLMYFYSKDIKLTLIVASAAIVCVIGVGLLSRALIAILAPFSKTLPTAWKLGFASLKRHQGYNSLQIVIFSLLFLLLFILITARTTLLSQWQNQLPEDAPNHFIFNIFPEDIPQVEAFFDNHGITTRPFYPMTRGRVIKVNDIAREIITQDYKGRTNYERELNLTWSNTLGDDNQILQGDWWDTENPSTKLLVSAEERYASGLGLQLGDTIAFSVAGQTVTAEVASIRSVQWDSMNPNFYMVFNNPLLGGNSANWITSFHLQPEQKPLLNQLTRQLPTISLIEIDQTISQVQSIISKVSLAIEFILSLVLVSGFLVLITSIQATLDVRMQEGAIYRTLGAAKALVRKNLLIEFGTLGVLAGFLAVCGTELCLYFLQTRVFSLEYQMQTWLWLVGPIFCGVLIGFIGWASARKVVSTPPLLLLRSI